MPKRHSHPRRSEAADADAQDPAAAGPSGGTPYTVYFPEGGVLHAADLEHAAPLPRVGDTVEYLDEGGVAHRFVVAEVIHSLQAAPGGRPRVRDESFTPSALVHEPRDGEELPESPSLRAGLPKVVLRSATPASRTRRSTRGAAGTPG